MEQPRFDRDRMLLYATLLCALASTVLYVVVYATLAVYGGLNASGLMVGRVALFVAAGTLGLGLILALTAKSASLSSSALSGAGWLLVVGGITLLFPAWGASFSATAVSGLTGFGGYAGAIFLLLAGGLLVQAERSVRERQQP